MRFYRVEGIILKRTDFGEADRLIILFTKQKGKLRLLAKGIRKISSRRAGSLDLFNYVSIMVHQGKKIDLIGEAQVVERFKLWRRDFKKIGMAYYFCELVDKLTVENQANEAIFFLLTDSLKRLAVEDVDALVFCFEKKLLTASGFGLPPKIPDRPFFIRRYIESITEREFKSLRVMREIAKENTGFG